MSGRRAQSAATLAGLAAAIVLAAVSAARPQDQADGQRSLRGQASALDARTHTRCSTSTPSTPTCSERSRRSRRSSHKRRGLRSSSASCSCSSCRRRARRSSHRRHDSRDNLRRLYEQGDTDPLAVVLGAQSLDDAITQLDDLTRVADQSKQVVVVTNAAQIRLAARRVRRSPHAGRNRCRTRVCAADDDATRRCPRASGSRSSSRLRSEQQLKAPADQRAPAGSAACGGEVAEAAGAADAAAAAGSPDPSAAPAPSPTAAPAPPRPAQATGGRSITVSSTGYSLPGHTATGIPVGWGVVAVDPSVIPLGTRLTIPGYGEAVAADTGSAIRGATIDLWFPTLAQAQRVGPPDHHDHAPLELRRARKGVRS